MPVNGNAGWIDEAIAEWEEVEYDPSKDPPKSPANLGNRSEYIRTTHGDAYSVGPAFLAHLDYVLRQRSDPDHGLKAFLAVYAQQKRHQSVTVKEFQELVEDLPRRIAAAVVPGLCLFRAEEVGEVGGPSAYLSAVV